MRFDPDSDGIFKLWLNSEGPIEEEVVAAGHLRQGKTQSTLAIVLGYGLWEILRPKRSKRLPRHFVLALTESELVAFKASAGGGGSDSPGPYMVEMTEEVWARYPRDSVSISGLDDEAERSQGAMLTIGGESFPICRPNTTGDPNTNEFLAILARQSGVMA